MSYPPLIIDVSGLTLTENEKNSLLKPSVAGVILFSRNYQDKTQLKNLTKQIKAIKPNLLICVDHEGGRVQRFRKGFTHLPAMAKLGEIFAQDEQKVLDLAQACGYILAYELLEVGVDFSFAPVVDKDYRHNTVIGDRAFSDKPETIIALANALMEGMAQAGMANVIKHFPGHGYVDLDSHLELPIDNRMIIQIHQDMAIFRSLAPKATAIMPAHIIYKKCDLKPAGFSKFWVQKILREKYKYQGVIISDDLSMQGAVNFEPDIKKRLALALDAGCDLVLICNQPEQVKQVLEGDYPTSSRVENLRPSTKLDKITYQNYLTKITPLL